MTVRQFGNASFQERVNLLQIKHKDLELLVAVLGIKFKTSYVGICVRDYNDMILQQILTHCMVCPIIFKQQQHLFPGVAQDQRILLAVL